MIAAAFSLPSTGYAVADFILVLCAVAVALAGLWVKVLRPISRAVTQVDEYGPVLRDIAKQFTTNGGSSLKDDLKRIQDCMADQTAALTRHGRELKRIENRIDGLPVKVRALVGPDPLKDEVDLIDSKDER